MRSSEGTLRFFSSRRRHTRYWRDWSSDVCSSDLGVLSGLGTGVVAPVLGATVANRWFVERRGLVLGIFGAAASAGQLVTVPALMWLVVAIGWRTATVVLAVIVLLVLVPVFLFMRDDPSSVGLRAYGEPDENPAQESPAPEPSTAVAQPPGPGGSPVLGALRSPVFWLLSGSFFICGASSNGIIGVHFVPHSIDHGISEVKIGRASCRERV